MPARNSSSRSSLESTQIRRIPSVRLASSASTIEGRGFWLLGVLGEKMFAPHFSIVLNVENFLDVRQTRFESVVSGPVTQPTFRPLYAPLDGIVANVALKITL